MSTFRRRLIIAASQISKWLSKETCNTIKDAFGDDGRAVIKATDAYLDGLDVSKAQNLVEFINEDPMMVCSLGLQVEGVTMPIRWNKSMGGVVYETPAGELSGSVTEEYETQIYVDNFENYGICAGISNSGNFNFCYCWNARGSGMLAINGSQIHYSNSIIVGKFINKAVITSNNGKGNLWINDELKISSGLIGVISQSDKFYIMNRNTGTVGYFIGRMSYLKRRHGGNLTYNYIPFARNGVVYMLDLVNNAYYPPIGTGVPQIAYTLQDGVTPWTPSTP